MNILFINIWRIFFFLSSCPWPQGLGSQFLENDSSGRIRVSGFIRKPEPALAFPSGTLSPQNWQGYCPRVNDSKCQGKLLEKDQRRRLEGEGFPVQLCGPSLPWESFKGQLRWYNKAITSNDRGIQGKGSLRCPGLQGKGARVLARLTNGREPWDPCKFQG